MVPGGTLHSHCWRASTVLCSLEVHFKVFPHKLNHYWCLCPKLGYLQVKCSNTVLYMFHTYNLSTLLWKAFIMGVSFHVSMEDTAHSTGRTVIAEVESLYLSWEDMYLFIFYATIVWCGWICLYECVSPCVSMSVRASAVHVCQLCTCGDQRTSSGGSFCLPFCSESGSLVVHLCGTRLTGQWASVFCPHRVAGMQRL